MRTVASGAAVTEYGVLGDGPPVVMLPGRGGEGTEQFEGLGRALADTGFTAVAVNLRGVGRSSGPLAGLSLHDLAHDVATVIHAVGSPAHVVGRALGNRLARCVAVDFPAIVRSVTLVAAGGLVPPAQGRGRVTAPGSRAKLRYWPQAGQAQEHAAQTTPVSEWWSGGTAPMLVLQGLEDHIAVPENGRRLAADHPDRVRLCEFENAGHMLLVDCPERVIPEITAFLREIDGAA